MTTKVQNYLEEEVIWSEGADHNYPYEAKINGDKLVIRLNDFPDESLYTLLVNDKEVSSFDDWPKQWSRGEGSMSQSSKRFIGNLDAQEKFLQKNPGFLDLIPLLNELTHQALNLPQPQSLADHLILELGSLAAEDLSEVVILCYNGLGRGALKILRGMFERTVTLFHLDEHPNEAQAFENYDAIDKYKMAIQLQETHPGEFFTDESFAKLEEKRDAVKGNYLVSCTCTRNCPNKVISPSWSKMGIVNMAKERGFKGIALVYGYYLPLMETHPKMGAIYDRLKIRAGEAEVDDGTGALMFALLFMFEIVRAIKERFKLDAIEELYQKCISIRKEMYGENKEIP